MDEKVPLSERPDRGAAESLDYERLRERLVRAVSRTCPAWLANQQDDIIQLAVLKVHQVHQAEGSRFFSSSYLTKVAYSAVIDEIRRLRRRREASLDDVDGDALRSLAADTAEASVKRRELGHALGACLSRLVEARRQATVAFLQGHRVPEIAHLLGWDPKRAENLVYRGLADLRKCLVSKGFEP